MGDVIKYVQSSFNMSSGNINNLKLDPKLCGRSSILKEGNYNVFVSEVLFSELKNRQETFRRIVKNVLETYEWYLNGKITFGIVDKAYLADFNVYWARTNDKSWGMQYNEGVVGSGVKKRAVTIGVLNNKTQLPLSDDEVYHLVLHEFGHLLGLGHSYDVNDVMGYGPYHTSLSKNDIFVLQLLYSLPYGAGYGEYEEHILELIEKYEKNARTSTEKEQKAVIHDKKPPQVEDNTESFTEYNFSAIAYLNSQIKALKNQNP